MYLYYFLGLIVRIVIGLVAFTQVGEIIKPMIIKS